MEKCECVSLIIKPIEIIFKTYGNFIYLANPWKILIKIHGKLYHQSNYLFDDYKAHGNYLKPHGNMCTQPNPREPAHVSKPKQ